MYLCRRFLGLKKLFFVEFTPYGRQIENLQTARRYSVYYTFNNVSPMSWNLLDVRLTFPKVIKFPKKKQ